MTRRPVSEAKLNPTDSGMKPEGDGWFVVNVADAMSLGVGETQYGFIFEGGLRTFPHFGINVRVLQPSVPSAMYHADPNQEAFLVLDGECVLVVEEEERRLRQCDFAYCPPGTAHVIVGSGYRPCAVLMVGARTAAGDVFYPASTAAARHGASVAEDTSDRAKAYAGSNPIQPGRYAWPPA